MTFEPYRAAVLGIAQLPYPLVPMIRCAAETKFRSQAPSRIRLRTALFPSASGRSHSSRSLSGIPRAPIVPSTLGRASLYFRILFACQRGHVPYAAARTIPYTIRPGQLNCPFVESDWPIITKAAKASHQFVSFLHGAPLGTAYRYQSAQSD